MDKEIVVCIYNGMLFNQSALCNSTDKLEEHKGKSPKGALGEGDKWGFQRGNGTNVFRIYRILN